MTSKVTYDAGGGETNTVWGFDTVGFGENWVYVDDRGVRLIPVSRVIELHPGRASVESFRPDELNDD